MLQHLAEQESSHHALRRVIQPLHQLDGGALPTAAVPDQGHRLPTPYLQVEALQDLNFVSRWIMEVNISEFQISFNIVGFVPSV